MARSAGPSRWSPTASRLCLPRPRQKSPPNQEEGSQGHGSGTLLLGSPSGQDSYRSAVDIPLGVAAKLDRADKHLADLGRAVEDFLESKPFDAARTVSDDGHDHIISWTRTAEIPVEIALIAGDAVHNVRSALDHLAVEIERASALTQGHELTVAEERRPQFSVALNDADFETQVKRYFTFTAPATIDVIRVFQPCSMVPVEPKRSPLYQVSNLDNADKHRVLPRTPISPVSVSTGWSPSHRWQWIVGPRVPFAPGVEVGRYRFAEPTSVNEAPLEFRFGLTLVTDPWVPHDIRHRVAELVKTIRDGVIVPICLRVDP